MIFTCRQWKAEKSPIHAISINGDGTKLIVASRSIKVWDVATQQILTVCKPKVHITIKSCFRCYKQNYAYFNSVLTWYVGKT